MCRFPLLRHDSRHNTTCDVHVLVSDTTNHLDMSSSLRISRNFRVTFVINVEVTGSRCNGIGY